MNHPDAHRSSITQFFNGPAAGLLLVALVVICFGYTLTFGYIWDDDQYLTDNLALRNFAGLSRIWTDIAASPQYYPVTFTSFWLEYQFFGFEPRVSHGINVALHACSVLLLFHLLRGLRVPGAWLAAAIFAVHPLNVESVAWITERKNTLSLALGLAAINIFLRYRGLIAAAPAPKREPTDNPDEADPIRLQLPTEPGRLYALFLVLYVCALLSKTTAAVLPGVLIVILWWKRGRLLGGDVKALIVPLVLGVAAGLLTSYIETSPKYVGAVGPEWELGAGRFALAGQTAWFYVGKLLLPHPFIFYGPSNTDSPFHLAAPEFLRHVLPWPLMFNYPRWAINAANPLHWAGTLGVIAVVATAFILRKRIGRGLLAGVLLYLGCLLPASGLFNFYPMRFSYVADHFAYMASIPAIVLGAAALAWIGQRLLRSHEAMLSIGAIILILLGTVTVTYSTTFHDPSTLWPATLQRNDRSWLSAVNYGAYVFDRSRREAERLMEEGEPEKAAAERQRLLAIAEAWIKQAIRRYPDTYEARYQLARIALERGHIDAAQAYAEESRELAVRMHKTSFLQPYLMIAQLSVRKGDLETATRMYTQLQAYEPDFTSKRPPFFATARTEYGDLLLSQVAGPLKPEMSEADSEKVGLALDQYSRAIEIAPQLIPPKLRAARVILETRQGTPELALQLLNDVLSIDRNSLEAQYLAALIAFETRQYQLAGAQLATLIKNHPGYLPPYVKLAEAFEAVDRRSDAISTLKEALKLKNDYEPARALLARLEGASTRPATQPVAAPVLPDSIETPPGEIK